MTSTRIKLRVLLWYGLSLGGLLSLMMWARYYLLVVDHALELYLLLLAVVFVLIGIWAGVRWSAPARQVVPANVPDLPNVPDLISDQPVATQLGISTRELDVLLQLARGLTNEEIADQLFVSTNTVKTHLGNLYVKLNVKRRTQAIDKARTLGLIR